MERGRRVNAAIAKKTSHKLGRDYIEKEQRPG